MKPTACLQSASYAWEFDGRAEAGPPWGAGSDVGGWMGPLTAIRVPLGMRKPQTVQSLRVERRVPVPPGGCSLRASSMHAVRYGNCAAYYGPARRRDPGMGDAVAPPVLHHTASGGGRGGRQHTARR